MFRRYGRWCRPFGPGSLHWTDYGWPNQYGRGWHRGWYPRRFPFGGLVSTVMTVALIALAISWWQGRRSPLTW
jgi:hypothetical protein